jgi:hypothetical protein
MRTAIGEKIIDSLIKYLFKGIKKISVSNTDFPYKMV